MDKGGCGDQKSILIVLHGDLKINNQKNLSGGHQNNASTGNSNIGVEEKTSEELQQQQNQLQLQTLTAKSTITSSQISELCWEVFDLQNKKSLKGVQSIKQEDFNLQSIQSYILDISQDPTIQISFLISDQELYSVLQGMSNLDWIYKYEIFDILHQAELIFSEKKDSIKQLIDYFSFQKDQQTAYKSETFQTATLISKTVSIMLRTTIPFKDPLNQEFLDQKNQTLTNKTENKESQKNILQSPQLKIMRQSSENSNQRIAAKKEELWSDQQDMPSNGVSQYYLKLRGIPYNAKESEILDFLGITLDKHQMVFKYDKDEKFTGECFIKAKDQAQFDKIKNMHKKTMKKRYIEIFVADKSEFVSAQESQNMNDCNFYLNEKGVSSNYGHGLGQLISTSTSSKNENYNQFRDRRKASRRDRSRTRSSRSRDKTSKSSSRKSNSFSSASSSSSQSQSSSSSHIRNQDSQSDSKYSKSGSRSDSYHYLRLRGLPFNAREAEIQQFLGISLDQDQITFKHDNDGRFSGECVIRTKDQTQLDRIKDKHMKNMGKRYIEVFVAEKTDFLRAQDSQIIDDQKGGMFQINSQIDPNLLQSDCIVKIRGLPYNATDQDIQKFFKDSQIVQNGIQKVYDGKRPSGEAFIIFATKKDAQKAIEKDKEKMGTRYIEIFLSHLKEFTNHIKKRKQHFGGNGNSNGGSSSSSASHKFSNHGHNGNRQDKYSNNQGGFSNHNNHGRNNNNEGRFNNNHYSRYSNSPHRNYGNNGNNHNHSQNGSGFYKKGMGSVNGNYDRNTKEFQEIQNQSKFQNNDEKFSSNNNNNNNKYYNNSYNNNNGNSNHSQGGRNSNNYPNDFNNKNFKNKNKEEYGKYNGSNNFGNKQYDNNQFSQTQQHNQYQNQPQPSNNQQQQPYNKNQGTPQTQNDGRYYGGNYDYQYQNQQQSQQMSQQQSSSSSGYPQGNNQINKNYNNNSSDSQQYSHHQHNQHSQQQNYYNNSSSGQYQQQQQQYQNQQYNSNNSYDNQHQPINYNQYNNQSNNNQQNYPPNNYYGQNQQDHNQQQQNLVSIGQQGHPQNTNNSHNQQPQYYQPNMFDIQHQQQQQQYRYY